MALRNQKGNFVLITIFGLGVLLCLGGVYYAISDASDAGRKLASDPKLVMTDLQERVERALANPIAIDASVERNSNQFACLFSVSGACRGYGGVFLLYEGAASQPVSQLMRGSGVSFDGVGCSGFPSEACPFRVETLWEPVCGPGACENTKSIKVKARVTYNPGGAEPFLWNKEAMFTPALRLSQGVVCERGGGIWAATECLTAEQAAQRRVASTLPKGALQNEGLRDAAEAYDRARAENPTQQQTPAEELEAICPETIVVQGQFYTIEYLAPGRSQVHVPALNGCPAEDTFVFQCTPKTPATFEGEGQWVQVEAVMAPNCDERGNPVGQAIQN
jgi:hypothetical protein